MKIRIDRPTDPETARLWDEAKRACENRPLQLVIDDDTRPLLECARRAAVEVAAWPAWKRTEQPRTDADCCRGDLRMCRCVAVERSEELEDEEWMAATGGEE